MTAHTPGPWRIGTTEGAVVADVPIPEVEGSDHYEYYGGHLVAESIAPRNLPVIAAAPELLDLLKEVVLTTMPPRADFAERARAAIAKAEGRA